MEIQKKPLTQGKFFPHFALSTLHFSHRRRWPLPPVLPLDLASTAKTSRRYPVRIKFVFNGQLYNDSPRHILPICDSSLFSSCAPFHLWFERRQRMFLLGRNLVPPRMCKWRRHPISTVQVGISLRPSASLMASRT